VDLRTLPVANLAAKDPAVDWSAYLLDLLPAIHVCLANTPGSGPRVTKAWPMNHGMVGVRTRNGESGWFDCIAPMNGGVVDQFSRLDAGTQRLPAEGWVVYSPSPQYPPSGECYEHERVLGDSGQPLGWLSYDTC
jgi:putative lipoprotein